MSRRSVAAVAGLLILMAATSAVSILVFVSVVGGSGEASEPISAPTLSLASPTPDERDSEIARLSTEVARLSAENAALSAAAGEAAAAAAAATPEPAQESGAAEAPSVALFRIVPEQSEVRFILTEDLRGVPTTVVGVTDQVAGDIAVDFATPANSRIGMIRINVRTLTTDNGNRNNAIRAQILQSNRDEYEFSEFTPTAITGLPERIEPGQTVTFQIVGELKVRNIVRSVMFDAEVTLAADDRLEGTAKTSVLRSDYNLTIPNVPSVANVSETVELEIDFVAARVEA